MSWERLAWHRCHYYKQALLVSIVTKKSIKEIIIGSALLLFFISISDLSQLNDGLLKVWRYLQCVLLLYVYKPEFEPSAFCMRGGRWNYLASMGMTVQDYKSNIKQEQKRIKQEHNTGLHGRW